MRIYATILLLFLAAIAWSQSRYAAPQVGGTISLGESVLPSSVKIYCGDTLLPDEYYYVAQCGTIFVEKNFPCDSIRIEYTSLNTFLPSRSRHRLLWGTGVVHIPASQVQNAAPTASFRTNGSLLRGIKISNTGDVSSTSALHFEAEGDLAGDIHITALLSDEGSPIQPEGQSLEISELDKVLIQAKSPHLSASFGDVDLNYNGGSFLELDRRIQGIEATADYEKFKAQAFGSLMRGQFTSNKFSGQEGNQGPYPLTGEQSERDIVVVAGTEKVWLNGEPIKRGENNDYVMDYNLAQITFTNNRPIGSDDRIVVDFQYISENYPRTLFGGAVFIEPNPNMTFGIGIASQRDDKNNPLAAISDSAMQIISESGDSVPDSLTAPQAVQVSNISMSLGGKKYSLGAEYSFSDNDKNLYSNIGDGDNFGDGFAVSGTLKVAKPVKVFAGGRFLSSTFATLGRIDPADFDRDWSISSSGENVDDLIANFGASADVKIGNVSIWLGQRKLGSDKSQRGNIASNLKFGKWTSQLSLADAKSSSSERATGEISTKYIQKSGLSLLQNDISAERFYGDDADTINGEISQKIEYSRWGFKFGLNGALSEYLVRRDAEFNNFSRTYEIGGSVGGAPVSISYSRRFFDAVDTAAGEDQKSDLISLKSSLVLWKASASATYQVSRSQSEILQKVYTYVGEGEGSYSWDEEQEEYIPDTDGDYILEYQPTGEFQPVIRSDGSFSLSAPMDFVPYGASASADVSFHSENQSDGWNSYYISPQKMFADDSLTSGNVSATLRTNFLKKSPLGIQWTTSFRKSAYRNYSSGAELSARQTHTLGIVGPLPAAITSDIELNYEKTQALRPTLDNWVDAKELSASLTLSRRFWKWLRTTAQSEYADIVDDGTTPQTNAQQLSTSLDAAATLKKITIRTNAQRVLLKSGASYLPYELSSGWNVGENFEWKCSVSYRAGAKTELSLIYRGEKKASSDAKHTGEMRVRLLF